MKTTSSQLFRGVMLIAALLVPVTTWWASSRYYYGRRESESRRQLARLQEIRDKYADIAKDNALLRDALQNEDKRIDLFKSISAGTAEFVLKVKPRSTWIWPTDPDHVWHDQRRQANIMLMKHGLPVLDVPNAMPDSPAPPRSLRFNGQK